jgi:hypothetical protein
MTAPRSLLVGFDGCVIVAPAVAEELAEPFRAAVAQARRNASPLSPAALDVIEALDQAAKANRARRSVVADVVADLAPTLYPGKVSDVGETGTEIGLAEVAAMTRRSRQAVLGRLHRGTLPGRRDHRGYWRIPLAAVTSAAE